MSPDGSRIVLAGVRDEQFKLFYRSLADRSFVAVPDTSRPASGTDLPGQPFFSPEGTWVAFFQDAALKKVQLDGGLPVTLCEASMFSVGVWRDDLIIYASPEGIFSVSDDGGMPTRLTGPAASGERYGAIAVVQDSPDVLVGVLTQGGEAQIKVIAPDTGMTEHLLDDARLLTHTASGHLLFKRAGAVTAASFDARTVPASVSGPRPRPGCNTRRAVRRDSRRW